MTLRIVQGNIFESAAEGIVNPVHCDGKMDAGLSCDFKERYPLNMMSYQSLCERRDLFPGRVFSFLEKGKFIFNFPTKDRESEPSNYRFIELGLNALVVEALRTEIKSLAIPPLGCGLAGLDFGKVSILIQRAFAVVPQLDVAIYIIQG